MKKLLTLLSVVAVAGAINSASAMDRSGSIGLGYQETFSGGSATGGTTANALGAWSLKYGVSSNLNAQFIVGFDLINKGGNNRANFGARVLYDLVENENSDFYTGLGIAFDIDKNNNYLRINIPLGYEWSFSGLPEIGFSAEAGIMFDYRTKGVKQSAISSVGGSVGGALGLGVHYYF